MTDDELADQIREHMRAMGRCGNRESAVQWMAQAYNLLDTVLRDLERPKVYVIPGSYGERTFTLAPVSSGLALPQPGFRNPPPIWFNGRTVEYGDRYQNRAWTAKDTRNLEKENARRAAMGLSTKRVK